MSNEVEKTIEPKLTPKMKRFCQEYVVDYNGKQAAIRAGYSENSAASIASENLTKPNVLAEVERIMDEQSLTAKQTITLISDIARSSLNDYMVIREVERRRMIKKPVDEIIEELRLKIKKKEMYAKRVKMNAKELKSHLTLIMHLKRAIITHEIELELNPDAFHIVPGEPELVEDVEIDFVRLAKDKQFGRVKSLSYTQFGPKVELYDAGAQLTNMARARDLFTERHQMLDKDGNPIDPNAPVAQDPLAPVTLNINVIERKIVDGDAEEATEQVPTE